MYKSKNRLTVKKGMKRFVARRSRVVRSNIDPDSTMVKCEAYDQIIINNGASSPLFCNQVVHMLIYILYCCHLHHSATTSVFWGRYKIVGINARASAGSSIATLDSAFVNCAPTLSIAFYPQLTSTALGSNPAYND